MACVWTAGEREGRRWVWAKIFTFMCVWRIMKLLIMSYNNNKMVIHTLTWIVSTLERWPFPVLSAKKALFLRGSFKRSSLKYWSISAKQKRRHALSSKRKSRKKFECLAPEGFNHDYTETMTRPQLSLNASNRNESDSNSNWKFSRADVELESKVASKLSF